MTPVRVVAVSDLHGTLPAVPPADVLVVVGDVCPDLGGDLDRQEAFLRGPFRAWLEAAPVDVRIGTPGNHDRVLEVRPALGEALPWRYLVDAGADVDGLAVWATPWTPRFMDWAFMAEEEALAGRFAAIPAGLDLLLSHGPPRGVADRVRRGPVGSVALQRRIDTVRPAVVVVGHIHEGRGRYALPRGGTLLNVAVMEAPPARAARPPVAFRYDRARRAVEAVDGL